MANINGTSGNDNLVGTEQDDTINGLAGNDTIEGLGGNDTINGGDGTDQINGGAGNDTINAGDNAGGTLGRNGFEEFDFLVGSTGDDEYIFTDSIVGYQGLSYRSSGLTSGVTITINGVLNTGTVDKGVDGIDTLTDIATTLRSAGQADSIGGFSIRGTEMNDVFNITNVVTTPGNITDPNGQWMVVRGNDGVDTYNITSGLVRLDFRGGTQSVNVDLSTGTVNNDGFGNAETITGDVWELRGDNSTDTLTGSSNDESFIGQAGNDTIDGGGGFDRLRFDRNEVERVNVDLSAGTALGIWDGQVFNYTISNIEWVRGSLQGGDSLKGDNQDNKLVGYGGSDVLEGGGGNDELFGEHDENGPVIVNGQSDAFVFRGNFGNDTIKDFAANDIIRFDAAVHGTPIVTAQGADVLISFTGLTETVLVENASVTDVNAAIEIVTQGITTTGDGNVDTMTGITSAGTSGVADGIADGTVTVTGGTYIGMNAAEQAQIGTTSDGVLNINGGAVVQVDASINNNFPGPGGVYGYTYQAVVAGRDAGSSGVINVDGLGSRFYVSGAPGGMRIGREGDGTLNVTNGGIVETFFLDTAREGTSTGTININGAGSTIFMNNLVGNFPNYAGSAAFGRIGRESGSKGYLNITNGGLLDIRNQDGVTDNPAFQIARNDGSYGKAVVDGVGSQFNITQLGPNGDSYGVFSNLQVGRDGQGILEIKNGGAVNVTGDQARVEVSGVSGSDAAIDPASRLEVTSGGQLHIQSSTGGTPVAGGAPGQILPGPTLGSGDGANSNASILIDGAGSSIDVVGGYGYVRVGREGTSTLTVRNGGELNIEGSNSLLAVGNGDDSGAQVNQSQVLIQSGGKINLTSTGNDSGVFVNLGRNSDGNGFMSVDGAGSQLNITSDNTGVNPDFAAFMNVGRSGKGELRITNGGEVNISGGANDEFPGLNIGRNAGSDGIVVVDGAGSALNVTGENTAFGGGGGFIGVGRDGMGYLTAQNGGVVQNDVSDGALFVGRNSGANGTIRVDGTGSLIDGGLVTVIGANFDFSANDISAVDFINGGTGVARAIGNGIIRSDNFFVGNGGTLEGNGTFDGNVTLGGDDSGTSVATLFPGTYGDPGATLNITGNLNMMYGALNMEVFSTTPGDNDIINVGGIANIDGGAIDLSFRNGFTPSAGDTFTIVSGTDLNFAADNVDINLFNGVAGQALVIADTGSDLVISALNNNGGEPAVLDFIAGSTTGVQANIEDGNGISTGGAFDSAGFTGITQFLGTNQNDIFDGSASTVALDIQGRNGEDRFVVGAGNDLLDGGNGVDTVAFQGVASNFTFTFNMAGDLVVTDNVGNEGINTLTSIELLEFNGVSYQLRQGDDTANNLVGNTLADYIIGFDGNDTINASSGDDIILAGAGDDTVIGGAGGDVLDGGTNGATGDTVSYSNSNAAVQVDLGADTAAGGHAEGDDLNDIENLFGSVFGDTLTGDAGSNTINGFNGNDTLDGGLGDDNLQGGLGNDTFISSTGADTFNGGTGSDTADYSGSDAGVTVQINNGGTVTGGHATGDTVIVENITGSNFADDLVGDTLANTLSGNDGDDTFNASSGNDTINGGGGDDFILGSRGGDTIDGGTNTSVGDTASYSNSDARVVADLATGTVTGSGHGSGDTLVNIENIFGSLFNDDIFGDENANVLSGFNGVDELFGRGGNDTLLGGAGFDFLNGGEGDDILTGGGSDDRFLFDIANFGADVITDFTNNRDRLDMRGSGLQFSDLTITTGATDTVITVTASPTNSITLQGVTSLINAADFFFDPAGSLEVPGNDIQTLNPFDNGGYIAGSETIGTLELSDKGGFLASGDADAVKSLDLVDAGGFVASEAPVEALTPMDLGGYLASDPVEALVLQDLGGYLPAKPKDNTPVEALELADLGGYAPTSSAPLEMLDLVDTGGFVAGGAPVEALTPMDLGGYQTGGEIAGTLELIDNGGYVATDDLTAMIELAELGGYATSETSAETIDLFDQGGYFPDPDESDFGIG